jgi:hypothetical protein
MNCFFNRRPVAPASDKPVTDRPNPRSARGWRLSLVAAAFGLLSAGTALAQTPIVHMTQPEAASLRLRFDNPTQRPAYLTVISLNNNASILAQTHREAAYGTLLKFDKLPAGTYVVSLRMGRNRYRCSVRVAPDAAGIPAVAVRETTTHRVDSGLTTAQL